MQPRIGVMEGVLKQPRNQVFAVARELGFSGLEIEVRADAPELLKFSTNAGLPICSLICGGEGAGDIQVERRVAARERLHQAIRDAAFLHASGILWPMFDLTSLDDGPVVDRFVEDVSACLPEAEAHGVVVAWENALDAADTRAVIERVGSDFFRCYFDFANTANRGADPVAELQSLSDLVYRVHAKNTNKQHLDAPGVDLVACVTELARQNYRGWIVLETPSGTDPVSSARHNLDVLKNALTQVQEKRSELEPANPDRFS